ncbi:MAG: peptidase M16 [Idiomarina sp.]|uniref:insulinase family protein n=1 Tax=Idiomarina sp. TaxID=1874361 RepID=UPI000C479460|nr:insulinase family protein [Idiomarina sp.]MBT42309.1 peptidase M16 [Idiomarina sp.]
MKKLFLASAISSVLFAAGCAQTDTSTNANSISTAPVAADQVIKSPNDQRQYRTVTLENQLQILLVSDPDTEKSAASLSVDVGLLHDPMTQQGMAHYLEHMLFLGTEKYPDTNGYSEFMSSKGGSQNAYTWLDITNYMFKVNNDAYDEGLDRFSDFFKAPMLYPEYVDKERNAVNAEWSMRREMDFFGQFKLGRALLGEHPANRFLIGNLETLSDKENSKLHEETVKFYNQYYSANIMKVAMLSNRSLDEMEALARKHFASVENDNIENPEVDEQLNFADVGGKLIHYVPNEDVKQLKLEFLIANNQDQFAVKPNRYVTYLLGSEMPGTPAATLKEAGLISSLNASASPDFYENYGVLSIDFELTDAGMEQREEIVRVMMDYIKQVKSEGVDEKYSKEIRTSLQNRFRFLEKGDEFSYVSSLAEAMQNYPAEYVISAPYEFQRFNPDAINNVLDQLTPERLRIWYISQQEPSDSELKFYDGKYKVVELSEQQLQQYQQPADYAVSLPKVNELLPESFAIRDNASFAKPKIVTQEPGLEVWQYPSQKFADQPRGILTVNINNEAPITDIKSHVLAALWRDLYSLNTSALDTEASIAGMNLSLANGVGMTLTVSGFTDKQPELLNRALSALAFNVEPRSFKQAVDRYIRAINNKGQQFPLYQSFDAYGSLIREGSFAEDELIKTAQSLSAVDLEQFMSALLSNNTIRAFAFGNYNQADIDKAVAQVKTNLPDDRNVSDYRYAKFYKPQQQSAIVLRKDLDVADVGLVEVHMHPEPGFAPQAAGTVLQSHFRTAAFDTLRTEEQLAYAVGTFAPTLDRYTGLGLYIQTPVKNVADMHERFNRFKQEYWQQLKNMSVDKFEQLKSSTLITLNEPPKNLNEEVAPILSDWALQRFDFDSKQALIQAVEALTLEQLKAFYQATLLNPEAARISVQLRGEKFAEQPFADIPNMTVIESLSDFHQTMPKQ